MAANNPVDDEPMNRAKPKPYPIVWILLRIGRGTPKIVGAYESLKSADQWRRYYSSELSSLRYEVVRYEARP